MKTMMIRAPRRHHRLMDSAPSQPVLPGIPSPRRVRSARILGMGTGLESKLLLSFTGIVAMAVGMSCFLILQQQRATVAAMIETQALGLSRGLAAAASGALERNDRIELSQFTSRLMTQRNVLGGSIFTPSGRLLASSGPAGTPLGPLASLSGSTRRVVTFDPMNCSGVGVGTFLAVTSPVLSLTPAEANPNAPAAAAQGFHVVGYVTVCLSEAGADAEIDAARLRVVLIGTLIVLSCFPLAAMLIHKLLDPIRCLVAATQRISAGDLAARVNVDRQDVIGRLARSFNQMMLRLRQQQEDLARANRELESKVRRTAQLQTANKRLSHEIAEKEEFLRAVSHDLNAPLRNISGMADMLMRKRAALDADVIHRLERIQKNVEVETNLIGELLELSRIEDRAPRRWRRSIPGCSLTKLPGRLSQICGRGGFNLPLMARCPSFAVSGPASARCFRT